MKTKENNNEYLFKMLPPNVATKQTEITSLPTTFFLGGGGLFYFLRKPFTVISNVFFAQNKQPLNFLRNYAS